MKNRKIIASCMLALSLVGCTGFEAGNGGYTTAGGAGGAAVGALAGQIIGKDTKGTLIGAAVGSLLGMGWGAYKDNQARELRAALKGTQAEVRNDGNALVVNLPGGVTFANISSGFYSALNGVAQTLVRYPETRIQVNGYTDSTGGDAHNQELSQRRANSVAQYLISQGVSSNRIVANGFGSSNPIASNATPEGRQANRRVEVRILPAQ